MHYLCSFVCLASYVCVSWSDNCVVIISPCRRCNWQLVYVCVFLFHFFCLVLYYCVCVCLLACFALALCRNQVPSLVCCLGIKGRNSLVSYGYFEPFSFLDMNENMTLQMPFDFQTYLEFSNEFSYTIYNKMHYHVAPY